VGESSGVVYKLGDQVKIEVAKVDLEDRKIDFELVEQKSSAKPMSEREKLYANARRKASGKSGDKNKKSGSNTKKSKSGGSGKGSGSDKNKSNKASKKKKPGKKPSGKKHSNKNKSGKSSLPKGGKNRAR